MEYITNFKIIQQKYDFSINLHFDLQNELDSIISILKIIHNIYDSIFFEYLKKISKNERKFEFYTLLENYFNEYAIFFSVFYI